MNAITSPVHVALTALVLVGTATGSMPAQQESTSCATIVATLRSGHRNAEAIERTAQCPVSGPSALGEVWERVSELSGAERGHLVEATSLIRDVRLLNSVVAVATDPGRADQDRVAALQVLMRYYNPGYAPSFAALLSKDESRAVATRIDGPQPINGAVALPATTRKQIGAVLAQLSASDPSSAVQGAARLLRSQLAYDDPENTPVADGMISLVAGCGRRVTLRSTADVGLRIDLTVVGTSFSRTYGIRAGTKMNPAELLLGLPKGAVAASYGGRELARLSERNAPCPPGIVP